jgi:hypothetical protein
MTQNDVFKDPVLKDKWRAYHEKKKQMELTNIKGMELRGSDNSKIKGTTNREVNKNNHPETITYFN